MRNIKTALRYKFNSWRDEIWNHKYLILLSMLFLLLANISYWVTSMYVDKKASAQVTDLILDHIPAMNLTPIFTTGFSLTVIVLFLYPFLFKVRHIHVVISQLSLLVFIRSIFITLTHMRAPADAILSQLPRLYDFLVFNNDLFFSGHAAVPFLGFLLFRKEWIGKYFLIVSIILSATVLLMHVHYSIDVFAAFFITYGSYKIGNILFKKLNK